MNDQSADPNAVAVSPTGTPVIPVQYSPLIAALTGVFGSLAVGVNSVVGHQTVAGNVFAIFFAIGSALTGLTAGWRR